MAERRWRIAIVGAGIGAQHLEGCREAKDRVEAALICDIDRARAEKAAGDSGLRVETELDRVLADPDVDIVDICLPPHLHLEACESALGAGKHVICEKPLVGSLAEMDRLEEAARRSDKRVFPVFQYRFGDGFARLRALIDAGLAGKPLVASLETHWNRGADYYTITWRGTWAGERGGAVLGHAIHAHDLLCWIFGPVAEVQAALATRVNPIEVEDCAAIALRMASGAVATSSITLGAAQDETRLRFVFETLTATCGPVPPYKPAESDWTFTARAPARQADVDRVIAAARPTIPGYGGLFEAIADALEGKGGREVTLADGRRSIELVTAIYAADRFARPQPLPLPADHPLYREWLPAGNPV